MLLRNALVEGVSFDGHRFTFDFSYDGRKDFLKIVNPQSRSPHADTSVKVFRAFACAPETPPEVSKLFKQAMKMADGTLLDGEDWEEFIDAGVERFAKLENLSRFRLAVTPKSSSHLANNLMTSLERHIDRDLIVRDGIVKAAIHDVEIDEETLVLHTPVGYSPDSINRLVNQARAYLKGAVSGGVLQMRKIPTNLRRYVTKFLKFDSATEKKVMDAVMAGGPVLFVDDIVTTRSTVTEAVRLIKGVNPSCEVVCFVLLD